MSYTKLFKSIVTSTIWTEDSDTCKVWVTMLAIANKHGEVEASVPGLAQISGVPLAAVEAAIAKFLAPDKYSRTPDDEGRRIEEIDGGWSLLNHAKYREMASREEEQSANAKRQARFREKKARNAKVTNSNGKVTDINGKVTRSNGAVTENLYIAEADTDTDPFIKETTSLLSDESDVSAPWQKFWEAYPQTGKKRSSRAKVQKAWASAKPPPDALATLEIWKADPEWIKESGQYVPAPHRWLRERRWQDYPAGTLQKAAQGAKAGEIRVAGRTGYIIDPKNVQIEELEDLDPPTF